MTLLFQRGVGWEVGQRGKGGEVVIKGLSHFRTEKLVNNTVVAATSDPDQTYCTLNHHLCSFDKYYLRCFGLPNKDDI